MFIFLFYKSKNIIRGSEQSKCAKRSRRLSAHLSRSERASGEPIGDPTFKSFKCVLSCIKYFNDAFNIGIVYFSLTQFSNKAVKALLQFVNETDNWEIDDYRGISDFLDLLKFVSFIDNSSYDIIDRLNFIEQLDYSPS